MDKPKKEEIGALWLKGEVGKKFFSGVLSLEGRDGPKINVVVFKNDYKKEDKHPDYKIFRSTPRETQPVDDDSDIPF